MKLARPPQRETPETIITLIDVVFFLLIFFMLIGRMEATAPFKVDPAVAFSGSDLPAGGILISVSKTGELALGDQVVTGPELDIQVQAALETDPKSLVRITAHKQADLQKVLPLIARMKALGGKDIVLVVTPGGS